MAESSIRLQPPFQLTYIAPNKQQTSCTLHTHEMEICLKSSGQQENKFTIPYDKISQIDLRKPDIGRYAIRIRLANGEKFQLKNLVFFKLIAGQPKRLGNNPEDQRIFKNANKNYRSYVFQLHNRIRENKCADQIQFTYGSTRLKVIILVFIIISILLFWPMIYLRVNLIWHLQLTAAVVILGYFYTQIRGSKRYQADEIPLDYLPTEKLI